MQHTAGASIFCVGEQPGDDRQRLMISVTLSPGLPWKLYPNEAEALDAFSKLHLGKCLNIYGLSMDFRYFLEISEIFLDMINFEQSS